MMLKRLFLSLIGALLCTASSAQKMDLEAFNAQRFKDQHREMAILSGWGAGTLLASGIGYFSPNISDETKAFHRMNAVWGGINLTIGALGYYNTKRTAKQPFTLSQSVRDHHKHQRIMLFNAGMDCIYTMTGVWMLSEAQRKTNAMDAAVWRGSGKAVIYNGLFLLAFDLSSALYAGRLNKKLDVLIDGNGLGMTYRF